MEAVHGIQSLASGDGHHHLSRTLGPALLISVGYIDLGKWVATVDAGARFGYDLVLLVLLFNFSSVLYQYMCTCIGMVTEKNLAQISDQEYSRFICVGLGVQAGLSLLTSELTMISGIAVGFNLVFDHDDLITGIIFACVVINLLPYLLSPRDKRMSGMLNACIAGFTILCFVLGLLISQPEIPLHVNVMFPKLSGESAYSLMALMGANIISHNFYVHSSVVQVQKRSHVLTLRTLFHDHLFSILFISTGVFLVNYVLLSSAASESSHNVIHSFHDAVDLMNQIFTNPMAPLMLLAVLLFSSHIISLTCVIASRAVMENFFGANLSLSAHHVLLKPVVKLKLMSGLCTLREKHWAPLITQKILIRNILRAKKFKESDNGAQQSTAHMATIPEADSLAPCNLEESKSVVRVDFTESTTKVSTAMVVEQSSAENIKMKSTAEKDVEVEADVCTDKDNETSHNVSSSNKSTGGKAPSSSSSDPPSLAMSRYKEADAISGSSGLSRQPGLGRAARRQLAAILDEFWGHLFDYHGKLTQKANSERINLLLGLDLGVDGSAGRTDNQNTQASKNPLARDTVPGSGISSPYLSFGLQMGAMGSSAWSQSMHLPNTDALSSSSTFLDQNAKEITNYDGAPYCDNQLCQPATIHAGYQLANYLKVIDASRRSRSSIPLKAQRPPISSESAGSNYAGSAIRSFGSTTLQNPTMSGLSTMMVGRSYYDPTTILGGGSSAYPKKYQSSPDISAVIAASRNSLLNKANMGSAAGNQSYLSRVACEKSRDVDAANMLQSSMQSSMNTKPASLWSRQPFEQLFGVPSAELNNRSEVNTERRSNVTKDDFSYKESEAKLLQSLRFCIMKLLKLEGSRWLFRQNGGRDEDLIDQVAAAERVSQETTNGMDVNCMHGQLNCGGDCVWQASLVVSFGVWCIRRVLDLSLVESRPELWGKYTYVLNRLQGILDPAFCKPRKPVTGCSCLEKARLVAKPMPATFTAIADILLLIKDVEQAVSGRRGRSGTVAGDGAFPKGKENLASVLKRYKRRLSSNKPPAGP
ncbi:protein ETHYLENE-INSENSITIVE 2-like isoform X2 [Triticum dicoccoides]|uniref:protein ETHYLENE-INSENSITIVE 2-like isoform X2 n=1 Tax=Triticum dicoccoides TaxID=85692 RepID=UPI0018905B21|nr:protein ETHYLENE-INSENSITIVE 2-like isoform X2 [Triticum dicoccoides]